MNSFNTQLHSDEDSNMDYQPNAEDMAEYGAFLEGELQAEIDAANLELLAIDDDYDEEWEYENDGQPDEAQEWFDYDSDC